MQKLNVVFSRIHQGLIEIRVTGVKSCHMDLSTNVTIVINFLQDQTNKQHMEHCSGVPGIVYNFNNQKLATFEDNPGYKGDLAVVA